MGSLAKTPVTWLLAGGAILAWPTWLVLAPHGIALRDGYDPGTIYELAFVGLLAGAALGAVVNARGAWILSELPPKDRNLAEAGTLFALTAAGGGLVLVSTLLPGTASGGVVTPVTSFLAAAHVAALAFLICRFATTPGLRVAALVSICWVIPALLSGLGPAGQAVAALVDGTAALAWDSSPLETPGPALVDVTPVVAGVLAALLLDPPSTSRR